MLYCLMSQLLETFTTLVDLALCLLHGQASNELTCPCHPSVSFLSWLVPFLSHGSFSSVTWILIFVTQTIIWFSKRSTPSYENLVTLIYHHHLSIPFYFIALSKYLTVLYCDFCFYFNLLSVTCCPWIYVPCCYTELNIFKFTSHAFWY